MTNSEKIVEGLNPQQAEAVLYTDGPLLIMAGAGSGKTRVLTHKIAHLVQKYNVKLSNILAVTFTNKAAAEMKERVAKLVGPEHSSAHDNWIMTFHSFGFRVLKMHADRLGYEKNFVVYDSSDQVSLIKQIFSDLIIDAEKFKPKAISYQISKAKNSFIFPEQYKEKADTDLLQVTAKVYEEYQARLKHNNAMDFDDLLINTVLLLKQEEDILEKFQKKFEFVLIDEYQDINMPQYHISYMLSSKHRRLFVVGDTDQNIYSWRGANLQNILNFEKDFQDAKVVLLEQNYRSTSNILNIANSVIINNKMRKDKSLWTDQKGGEKATFYVAQNEYDEAEYVANKIKMILDKGVDPKEIALLYRTNAMSRVLENILMQNNIPYRIYGGLRFYDRKEIKDVFAYLKLLLNPNDDIAFQRVVNVPSRKIGKLTLQKVQEKAIEKGESCFNVISELSDIRGFPALASFKELITSLQEEKELDNLSVGDIIELILKRTGYRTMLQQDKTVEAKARLENLDELKKAAAEQNYPLDEFISMSTLLTSQDEGNELDDALTLMTMHSAKGLEYDNVFILGLEENMLPHFQAMDSPSEIEEERRLCYVAVTRARKEVYMSAASNRGSYGSTTPQEISRFFYEMPPELLTVNLSKKLSGFNHIVEKLASIKEYKVKKPPMGAGVFNKDYDQPEDMPKVMDFKVGDVVNSENFGDGIVQQTFGSGNDISLQVKFGQESKLVMPKYAKLNKI